MKTHIPLQTCLLALAVDDARTQLAADYKVAAEECDALSGDAKLPCIAQAKTKFGKN